VTSSGRRSGRRCSTTRPGTSYKPDFRIRPGARTSTSTASNTYAGKARSATCCPVSPGAGYAGPGWWSATTGGSKSYYCKESFHTARREDLTDQVVVDIILARLNKPDILELLTNNDEDEPVRDAVAEAADKRARLQTFIDAAANGSITAAALGRIESKLMAEIEAAEARARRASSSHVLDQAVGIDRARWNALPITTRREIISAMCDVTIMPAGRGHRTFDPTLIHVRPHTQ
jgi:hypothetical protein